MATKPESTFTEEEQNEMRAEIVRISDDEQISRAQIARQVGIAEGTFYGWLAGTYEGNNDRVAGAAQLWLSGREDRRRQKSIVPRAPGFIATESARAFLEALGFAQAMPEISVIAGGAGIGKTTSVVRYAASNPNVWVATMSPSTSGINPMLVELCEAMGIAEKAAARLTRAIGRKVEGTGGLIVIDEAQHLTAPALDQLRSIYDRYAVGIALVGNEQVYARLDGGGRTAQFAQLFSRIGVRVTQARPRARDMCALIEAWGVTEAEQVKWLKAIARKPGALRVLTKCLQLASMLATGADEERGMKHLKAAWERLSASTVSE